MQVDWRAAMGHMWMGNELNSGVYIGVWQKIKLKDFGALIGE